MLVLGLTQILSEDWPLLVHKYEHPPLPTSIVLSPRQTVSFGVVVIEGVGIGLTYTVKVVSPEHKPLLAVTVYVVVTVGVTVVTAHVGQVKLPEGYDQT